MEFQKVLILGLSLLLAGVSGESVNEWDFVCKSVNERHVHELYCYRFYSCDETEIGDWKIILNSCPPGRVFNEGTGRCEDGECPPDPTSPCLKFSLYHQIFTGALDWDFQCQALDERFVHESYCNRYYSCQEDLVGNWVIQVHSCPPNRIFDEDGGRCVDGTCLPSTPIDCGSSPTSNTGTETSPTPGLTSTTSTTSTTTTTTTTTLTPPTSTTTMPPTTGSPFKCTEEGIFPDPFDCQLSHTCLLTEEGLVHIPVRCPEEQNYCAEIKACGDCPCSTDPFW